MKKCVTFILCAILTFNIALAQWQTVATKDTRPVKGSGAKDITSISGSMTCLSNYIPSATGILNFQVTFASPDQEYLDGLEMTFPTGMTPVVSGTSDPIAARTGCSTATGQLNPISGQTISWGQIVTPSQCGYLIPGTYTFSVGVTIGALTGTQTVSYTVHGDGYGGTPHTFTGNITVNIAAANDVGITAIIAPSIMMMPGAVVPQITVKNLGTATQTNIPVNYKIGTGGTVVSSSIASLAPGASTNVSFPSWNATNGNYNFIFYTGLVGDAAHANDTMKRVVSVSTATWSAGANTTLSAYMGSAAVCGGKLYAMGGNQPSAAGTGVAIYDVAADSWAAGPPLPAARVVGMAAGTSAKVYYLGGSDGTNYQTNVWELTPPGTSWAVKAPLPAAFGWAKTAVYQDSLIYVVGGYNTAALATVYLYNTINNTWRICTPMPAPAFGGACGITGNTIVWTTGVNSAIQATTYKGVIDAVNHATIVWTTGADIPTSLFRTDGGTWGSNEVIVATGANSTAWTPATPSPCYAYNPTTNVWRTLPNKTTPTLGGFTATLLYSSTPTTKIWKIVSASGYDGTAASANTEILTEAISSTVSPNDIAVTAIIKPVSSQVLTAADTVQIRVSNMDTVDHWKIPVSYTIDGGVPVNDTIFDTITTGGNVIFNFTQLTNLSIPGHVYTVKVYSSFPGDTQLLDDTLVTTVTNKWDVAPVSYDGAPVMAPATINPKATVKNIGTVGATFTVTMQITGGYSSTQNVTNLAPNASLQVTFSPWTAALGNRLCTIYTTLPADSVHANDTIRDSIKVINLTKFYCYVAYDATSGIPQGPAITYGEYPAMVTSLANQTGQNFVNGGTWGYGNKWYGGVYSDNTLITIDTLTGARTTIGPMGFSVSGLSFDYSTNTMYGMGWDGVHSNLYKVNIVSGASTFVGPCDTTFLVNLACDLSGNLYSMGTSTDKLYSINKTTGAATVIGPVGFNALYAQDMKFDLNTGVLYMAAYNLTTGSGELRTVNVSTGMTTLIGAFQDKAEITGLAIPYHTSIPAIDAAAVSVNGMTNSCALTATEPVQMTIKNFGTATISSLNVKLIVDGGAPMTETVTATIAPDSTYKYTFTHTADLSVIGTHKIVCITNLSGDLVTWNDTASVTVHQVAPSNMPYSIGFEPIDDLLGWTVEDANHDGTSWHYSATGGHTAPGCAFYSYNLNNAADDWLISTCLHFDVGHTFELKFYYIVASASYPENLKVTIGTDNISTALTNTIVDLPGETNTTYKLSTTDFTVTASGTFYLGWHCYSAANMDVLYVDDISITDVTGLKENDPAANFNIYPNPAQDYLNIISGTTINKVRVANTMGATVYESYVNGMQFRINTSQFTQGMYFITLETEKGIITRKIIIE